MKKQDIIQLIYNSLPLGTDLLYAIRIFKALQEKGYFKDLN